MQDQHFWSERVFFLCCQVDFGPNFNRAQCCDERNTEMSDSSCVPTCILVIGVVQGNGETFLTIL